MVSRDMSLFFPKDVFAAHARQILELRIDLEIAIKYIYIYITFLN